MPQVRWLTDGIAHTETGMAMRTGIARIRIPGRPTRVLRQSWEELAWTVELSTTGNVNFGAEEIHISPGLSGSILRGNYICFGQGFDGCEFPLAAIQSPRISYAQVCELGSGGATTHVMRATTSDGRRGTVVHLTSGGSGGVASSIEISSMTPEEYCRVNRDRGY